MEDLNKDPGPVNHGCGNQLFIWKRFHPRPAAKSGRAREALGQAATTPVALSEGCVLLHINDKAQTGSKKSLSYAHLFKKSQPHNTDGGSPQESSESKAGGVDLGGGDVHVNNKRVKQPLVFCLPKQGLPNFRMLLVLTNTKDTFTHFNGFIPA